MIAGSRSTYSMVNLLITNLDTLTGIFSESLSPDEVRPVEILAGFDAVVQFSRRLMQAQVNRSLNEHRLRTLSAFVSWGTVSLPAPLLSLLPPNFRYSLDVRAARLELRLVQPGIAELHWPTEIAGPADTPTTTSRRARRIRNDRVVDIAWRLEINVLTAQLPGDMAVRIAPSSRPVWRPLGGGQGLDSVVPPLGLDAGALDPADGADDDDGRWQRFPLAIGQVITAAKAEVVAVPNLWRFGVGLDFSTTSPAVRSEVAGMTEFVATEAGQNLLEQALAPLKAAAGLKLTPDVTPGGILSAAAVQRFNLPPFQVRDLLLNDVQNDSVLCLCAELGDSRAGVTRLVQPVLERQDFSYAVSTDVLSPALKARWNISARGLSFVTEIPVELPVSENSDQTETGRAQLRISFSETLDDVSIRAGTDYRGDPLRLMSRERIQLLNLWKHNNERVADLGELGEPQEEPFVLPLCLFDRTPGAQQQLQPNFKELLLRVIEIIVMPFPQPFPIGRETVSGFASSAMKAMLVRWSLASITDDIRPPIGGAVEGRT